MYRIFRFFKRPKIILWPLLFLLGGFLFWTTPQIANSATSDDTNSDRYVQIRSLEGTATFNGQPVKTGDRLSISETGVGLQTGANSTATLEMDDAIGTVEVGKDSQVRIIGLDTLESGGKVTQMFLAKGRTRVRVRRFNNPDSRFEIKTPSGNAGVRGTEFGLTVLPSGETRMAVISGTVVLEGTDGEIECSSGGGGIVFPGKPPIASGQIGEVQTIRMELLSNQRVRVIAKVHPIHFVYLNGQEIPPNSQGEFVAEVSIPSDRRLTVSIVDPLGREQVFELLP
ncbi:FecR family protein [Spirulina sp. 06S082]|uniref:FecR family protein n=1 Tax=Spirulina sp. 06S082 TaxID=3110248 RepID=UPI002B207AC5|nr:FecR family protein [Spirulina sp. 06S082]MEA5468425.1 FecR family protein [Spirulina sp. 06S082]